MGKSALVLLSGGLDSSTVMGIAAQECDSVKGLTMSYGQKHVREVESAIAVAAHYGVQLEVLEMPKIFSGAGSTLIDADKEIPHLSYDELKASEGPSSTYVPQRNLNFLAVASAIALTGEQDYIYFGAHADDAHNWAYPDCTPEFIGAASNAIFVGSYMKTRLRVPFMWNSKADIVRRGNDLGVPFEITWSCYEGGDLHCGLCPTCMSRQEAFMEAQIDDPTRYAEVARPA